MLSETYAECWVHKKKTCEFELNCDCEDNLSQISI